MESAMAKHRAKDAFIGPAHTTVFRSLPGEQFEPASLEESSRIWLGTVGFLDGFLRIRCELHKVVAWAKAGDAKNTIVQFPVSVIHGVHRAASIRILPHDIAVDFTEEDPSLGANEAISYVLFNSQAYLGDVQSPSRCSFVCEVPAQEPLAIT
jgi:hypothetical protein